MFDLTQFWADTIPFLCAGAAVPLLVIVVSAWIMKQFNFIVSRMQDAM